MSRALLQKMLARLTLLPDREAHAIKKHTKLCSTQKAIEKSPRRWIVQKSESAKRFASTSSTKVTKHTLRQQTRLAMRKNSSMQILFANKANEKRGWKKNLSHENLHIEIIFSTRVYRARTFLWSKHRESPPLIIQLNKHFPHWSWLLFCLCCATFFFGGDSDGKIRWICSGRDFPQLVSFRTTPERRSRQKNPFSHDAVVTIVMKWIAMHSLSSLLLRNHFSYMRAVFLWMNGISCRSEENEWKISWYKLPHFALALGGSGPPLSWEKRRKNIFNINARILQRERRVQQVDKIYMYMRRELHIREASECLAYEGTEIYSYGSFVQEKVGCCAINERFPNTLLNCRGNDAIECDNRRRWGWISRDSEVY